MLSKNNTHYGLVGWLNFKKSEIREAFQKKTNLSYPPKKMVNFVSNELKWPKLAIFGLFEGHRSPKMPLFTGMRPGSTSAHLNHEFLW